MHNHSASVWLYVATTLFAGVLLSIVAAANLGWVEAAFAWFRQMPGADKLAHFVLLGGMSLLLNLSLGGARVPIFGRGVLLGSLLLLILVTVEELSQLWISTRTFSLTDLACNYLGIALCGRLAKRWTFRERPVAAADRSARSKMA